MMGTGAASDAISEVILSAVEKTGRYPFLFIGSGLSRRYMGTPDWEGLLRGVCGGVLGDEFAYARYLSEARMRHERGEAVAELPYVATLMEMDVSSALLSLPRFEGFRSEHFDWLQQGGSPMRLYISDLLGRYSLDECEETEALFEAGRTKVSGVITTNFDGLCSALFPGFTSYVGEEDLLFRDPAYAQEAFLIHGSIEKPESLVLTDMDYRRFEEREKYLAAKLLTIFAEYPVLFMGYSMQDPNVGSILSSVARCAGPSRFSNLQDRLIFVDWRSGAEASMGSRVLSFDEQSIGMTSITTDSLLPVYRGLLSSQKLYDVKALRELRGSVFSIVTRLDPKSQVVVSGIDRAIDTLGEDARVVIGFGQASSDYGRSVKLIDLYRDVVLDDLALPAPLVAWEYLEDLLKDNSNSVPVYKYLDAADADLADCEALESRLGSYVRERTSIDSFLSESDRWGREAFRRTHRSSLSVSGLIESEGADQAFRYVKNLNEDEIDVSELRDYLSSRLHDEEGNVCLYQLNEHTYKSEFRKCVRIYDFLRYRYAKSPGLR